jgi:hypothetical protein
MTTNHTDASAPELGDTADKPEGPVAAAILAAGIGSFALGLFTTLAEASEEFERSHRPDSDPLYYLL